MGKVNAGSRRFLGVALAMALGAWLPASAEPIPFPDAPSLFPIPPGVGEWPLTNSDCSDAAFYASGAVNTTKGGFNTKSVKGCDTHPVIYYDLVSSQLGLPLLLDDGPSHDPTTLDDLIAYLGFSGLSAEHLEIAPPALLMPSDAWAFQELIDQAAVANGDASVFAAAFDLDDFQNGSVIAVRYFAPKVAKYSNPTKLPGWRKLVRLRARPGSPAASRGIRAGWVLFNELGHPDAYKPLPFGPELIFPDFHGAVQTPSNQKYNAYSDAIQLILEVDRASLEQAGNDQPTLYFFSFAGKHPSSLAKLAPYQLSPYLSASFDVPDAYPGKDKGRYYLPDACVQCHSVSPRKGAALTPAEVRSAARAKYGRSLILNILDTDQWQDVRHGEFAGLDLNGVPVLVDAGPSDPGHGAIMDRFRSLNTEILQQNKIIDPGARRAATRSVRNWLANHASSDDHIDRWSRILKPVDGTSAPWSPTNNFDGAILPLLEKYCSRCHMSMFFGIYDRAEVRSHARIASERISWGLADDTSAARWQWMPQGRDFDEIRDDMTTLVCYLDALDADATISEVPSCPQPN